MHCPVIIRHVSYFEGKLWGLSGCSRRVPGERVSVGAHWRNSPRTRVLLSFSPGGLLELGLRLQRKVKLERECLSLRVGAGSPHFPSLNGSEGEKEEIEPRMARESLLLSKISTKLLDCLKEFRLCFPKVTFWASDCDLCTKMYLGFGRFGGWEENAVFSCCTVQAIEWLELYGVLTRQVRVRFCFVFCF